MTTLEASRRGARPAVAVAAFGGDGFVGEDTVLWVVWADVGIDT